MELLANLLGVTAEGVQPTMGLCFSPYCGSIVGLSPYRKEDGRWNGEAEEEASEEWRVLVTSRRDKCLY